MKTESRTCDYSAAPRQKRAAKRAATQPRRLHRIADVMRQENMTIRNAATRMKVTQSRVKREMSPNQDLTITDLMRWQKMLKVPLADLIAEPTDELSPQVQLRGGLLKAMRTVRTIQEATSDPREAKLAERLAQQLTALMPELCHAAAWPSVGQRRTLDEEGAISQHPMPDPTSASWEQCGDENQLDRGFGF
ncbi:MAG: hypothetical protein AAF961_13815 [Planctomycetota bacterium]